MSADAREAPGLSVGSLFSGIGLLDFGLHLAGLRHVWFCEINDWRADLLRRRWPGVPVYPDVRAVDAHAPAVELVAGGFPCKGVSGAGRREGFGHPETALWREMLRVVRDLRPRYVLVENVADLLGMHGGECFGEVVGSLAALGYDAEWDCFPASAFGAPHRRLRVFVVATDAGRERRPEDAGAAPPDEGEPPGRSAPDDHEPDRSRQGGLSAADAPPDAAGSRREGPAPDADEGGRADARHGALAPSDAWSVARPEAGERGGRPGAGGESAARREARAAERRASGRALEAPAPPDADAAGRGGLAEGDPTGLYGELALGLDAPGRGVGVEWGQYRAAVERWEVLLGWAAPQPLIRRVDDGRSTGLERSRLSALGDGVLVQAGRLMGERLALLELERAT